MVIDTSQRLEKALDALWEREQWFAEKRFAQAERTYDHKIKRAMEYRQADGTIKEREMLADEKCAIEMRARFIAEAESEIAYQKLQDARAAVSARQSILNSETKRPI